jgi:hypothetical protein
MKRYYFTVLACLLIVASYSQNNQAIINNGQWNNNANWALGHVPANGEVAIIPQNLTLIVDDNIVVTTEITLKIYGTLNFQVGKLKLSGSSAVYVYPGGVISSQQGNASDKIEINGVSKYSGDEGTLTGPLMANAGTSGFDPMPIILPVKFIAYNISNSGNSISINWSTTEEENAAYYQVERSNDGITWQAIARIEPVAKPGVINNYTYTDKEIQTGLVYYRIKEVDKDGNFIYTSIKNIKQKSIFPELKIYTVASKLVVEFSQQIKGNVTARLYSSSGQVIDERVYYQPQGYIILEKGAYKGHCILSLINEDGLKIAQQVFLN